MDFSGVPSCTFQNPYGVMVDVTCDFSYGYLNISKVFSSYDSTVSGAVITITGLVTPIAAGKYPIGMFV